MTVFFDGGCSLCRPTIAVLRWLDLRRRVAFLDVTREWAAIHRRFPELSRDACLQEMHGIDSRGRRVVGFETYRALAWVLPLGWPLLPFLYLPPIPYIGGRVFHGIAARRRTKSCGLPAAQRVARAPGTKDRDDAG